MMTIPQLCYLDRKSNDNTIETNKLLRSTMKEIDQKWLEKLDEIITLNLSNSNFYLITLANDLAVSPAQLYRKIVALTGKSPKEYIRMKRLQAAKDLLERGVYATVAEVSLAVGYLHSNNFSIIFEQKYGRRPSSYLK